MSRRTVGPVRFFDEIDSTNRYLADEARAGAPSGLVAVAQFQTAGRGRLERRWEAPPGANLLMSVLLRPTALGTSDGAGTVSPHGLTIAMALAAADACNELAGIDPGLKWPNDLVVSSDLDNLLPDHSKSDSHELKLAGILTEILGGKDGIALVIGIGLNIGWPPPEPPEPEMQGATSISRLIDQPPDTDSVSGVLLDDLDRRVSDLVLEGGAGRQAEEYRRRCVTLGRSVTVEEVSGSIAGNAVGLTEEGHLIVETPSGRREVTAGDVVHLRHRY
jgi:BirA family transcriptional regulator, biotin operon repressor / biotin---[acetyl-CoA-carboxylase] ligase